MYIRPSARAFPMHPPDMLPAGILDPRRHTITINRHALLRVAAATSCVVISLFGLLLFAGFEFRVMRRSAMAAQEEALASAHEASVRLVRAAMELQTELDAQEDHDRWTLQLYLRLEREQIPAMRHAVTEALPSCSEPSQSAIQRALGEFGSEAHRHSHAMLMALQKQGSRARKRALELATEVNSLARSDRERLRAHGASPGWSDADLAAPLGGLARRLRRPNATFELSADAMREWEEAAAAALSEGGAVGSAASSRLVQLASAAPLPQNDRERNELLAASGGRTEVDPAAAFVALLQRARLHRHLPELLDALDGWEAKRVAVWDVVELIERLRAQHVFPISLLRLGAHEWESMLSDTAGGGNSK